MIHKILAKCGHIACTQYRAVLFAAIILTILALVPPIFFVESKFSASVSKLLPTDNESAKAFNRALNDFGTADEVFVLFRLADAEDVEGVGQYVVELADKLRDLPDFQDAYCRTIRPEEKGFLEDELMARGLLYLPPEGIAEVKEKLTQPNIARATKKTFTKITSPGLDRIVEGKESQTFLLQLGVGEIFQKHLRAAYSNLGENGDNGLLVSYDNGPDDKQSGGAVILLAAQPQAPAQRLEYANRIMDIVREETFKIFGEQEVSPEWRSPVVWWNPSTWNLRREPIQGKMPPALAKKVQVSFGGGYEVSMRYTQNLSSSLKSTFITSLIGVLLLFGYCYRRYGVALYVGVPLVMVVCWTMGAGWLLFGKLNVISCAFAAVLVGLGVDYAVHIYNRYIEERGAGRAVEESFITSLKQTGSGVVVGMLTTAMSFMALMVTRFKGLSQFGTLAALGLALALPAMIFVLPALVVWRSKRGDGEHRRALRSTTFYLPQLSTFLSRFPYLVAIIGVGLAVVSGIYIAYDPSSVRFDERLASLRPSGDPVFKLGQEISERFSRKSPARIMAIIPGNTEAEAMDNASEVLEKLKVIKAEGILKDFEILNQFIPSPQEQEKRLKEIAAIDFGLAASELKQQLDKYGLAESVFKDVFQFFGNHKNLNENFPVILPTSFKHTPAWRLMQRLVGRHKVRYRVDTSETPNAWEQLAAGNKLIISELPTTREGGYFFTDGIPIDAASIDYLESVGIPEINLTIENKEGLGQNDIKREKVTLAEVRKLLANNPKRVYFAGTVMKNGEPLLSTGIEITTDLLVFLDKSNCRDVGVFGEGWSTLAYLYPPADETSEISDQWISSLRDNLGEDNQKVLLTSTMLVAHDLATVVKEDFFHISIAVCIIAALVLAICYRNVTRVVFSLLPIGLALFYLFGIMGIANISFNFINVLVVPVIIGLGVDNGIHLVHRFQESNHDIRPMVTDTGRAIVITNLTSMIGFGSLWMGSYDGLTSMGMLTVLGLSMSMFASLIVLPALLYVFRGFFKNNSAFKT
ncbi:MAG: MMPL family transporter [Planctomycetes bacterium]|nr:MMPL family transporter [Planctomycetota bacterium]